MIAGADASGKLSLNNLAGKKAFFLEKNVKCNILMNRIFLFCLWKMQTKFKQRFPHLKDSAEYPVQKYSQRRKNMARRILSVSLAAVVAFVFSGCGTLMHKERINRTPSDKLDVVVVAVDCCFLLLGIIPGVVALIIDANNHTMYYSADEVSFVDGQPDLSKMTAIHLESMDEASIAEALSSELGRTIAYSDIQF